MNRLAQKPAFIVDEGMGLDSLANLKEKVDFALQLQEDIDKLDVMMSERKKALKKVKEEDIPSIMQERGITSIKLTSGEKVTIKQDLTVKILDNTGFYAFLDQHGSKELVKLNLVMDKMPDHLMNRLYEFLEDDDYQYTAENKIAHQTKLKFFRTLCGIGLEEKDLAERIADGRCLPIDALPEFAVPYVFYKTTIKK